MSSIPTTYLHFDSTYRKRSEWPLPGEFSVPIEGNNNLSSTIIANDAVASSSINLNLKWASNAFSLYRVADARDDPYWSNPPNGATLSMASSTDSIRAADGKHTINFAPDTAMGTGVYPQYINDYYVGAHMTYTVGMDTYVGRITQYMYFGDGACELVVDGFSIGTQIPAGSTFVVSDPTDTGIARIFVPHGADWHAYPQMIIFNETQNQWRPIDTYDPLTNLLTVYEGVAKEGQDGSAITTGSIAAWNNQDTYSIRQPVDLTAPFFTSPITTPSPTNTLNASSLWFEPKQKLTTVSFNLGPNVNLSPDFAKYAFIQLSPTPGSTAEPVIYQHTLSADGTTTTAILTVDPSANWTQSDFYKGMSISFDSVAGPPHTNQSAVRTVISYDPDSRTVTFAPALPAISRGMDQVSFHTAASAQVLGNRAVDYPSSRYRNELFLESAEITDYKNQNGVLAAVGTANALSLVLDRGATDTGNGAYTNYWISWVENGGCHARLINGSTYDAATQTTTVNFERPLGSQVLTLTLISGGAGYVAATPFAATTTVDPVGGTGLTVTVTGTAAGAITTLTVNDPGRHYAINDVVTIIGGGGTNATFRVTALADLPANTPWSIHSGVVQRTVPEQRSQGGFTQFMNLQPWIIMPFHRDYAQNFTRIGAIASLQSQVCYEIELLSLVLPNAQLSVGSGGRLAFYPYVFVELSTPGSATGYGPNTIMSNNPNSRFATFIASMDDVSHPLNSTFIKVDGDGMVQTIKFNPNSTLKLKVTLPNGEVIDFNLTCTEPPHVPNPLGQVSAVFSMKRLM